MLRRFWRLKNVTIALLMSVVAAQLSSSCSPANQIQKAFATSSPSFVRQEILNAPEDWILWNSNSSTSTVYTHNGYSSEIPNAKNISQCKMDGKFITPSIESVSYISNGKFLNATLWLTSPFIEPPINDTLDAYPGQVEIKVSNLTSHYTLQNYTEVKMAGLYNPLENFTINEESNSSALAGNNTAHKVVYTVKSGQIPLKKMELWTIKNNKVYDITYSALPSTYSDHLSTIQKMIDSFRIGLVMPTHITRSQVGNSSSQHRVNDFLTYRTSGIKIDYPVNWQKKEMMGNGSKPTTVTFYSPFKDLLSPLQPSYHEVTFTMAIDVASSVNDQGTGYRIKVSRIPYNVWTGTWTRQVQEVSAYDNTRVLEEGGPNYTGFYDKKEQPYILFYFDLNKVNSPQLYKAVFYITDYFVLHHVFCRLLDITNWIIIPPPEFTLSTPSNVVLRPGDEKDLEVVLKGNTNLPSQVFLNANTTATSNTDKSIALNFNPHKISMPPLTPGSTTLHVKILKTANATSYTLPISANISFPTTIKNRFGEAFNISKSESLLQLSNLTLTVLPPYTLQEQLSNFVNLWITPISGLWTFLAGVAAVITPLVIRRRQKSTAKRKHHSE